MSLVLGMVAGGISFAEIIDHASSKLDLTQLTIYTLPLSGLSMSKAGQC